MSAYAVRQPGWRTPQVVIAAGCVIALVTFGVRGGFGLFLAPISADLGWGREVFALAIAIQNLLWGAAQPVAGAIADRYGSARVLAVGAVVYAAGLALMSYASTPLMFHLSGGVLIGLGLAGASFTVVMGALSRVVAPERRSTAFGIATAASSMGQFLVVPLGQSFITAYGWQTALLLLACVLLATIPLVSALAGRAHGAGLGPDQTIGQALREARSHSGYVLLVLGFFVCGFQVAFITVHLPAYITDIGLGAEVGAWAIALVGLFNVVGSYLSGVLGGRHSKKRLLAWLYFARSVVITVFVLAPPSVGGVLVFAAVMGLLWLSTVPLTSGLVAQMFGVRYMTMLFGVVFFSHQVGSFLGVWLGGRLYDATGSYDVVWWASVALGLAAAAVHWVIDDRTSPRLAAEARA